MYHQQWTYRIFGKTAEECNYTRGVFNVAETGRFVAHEADVDPAMVTVKMERCDKCGLEEWWICVLDLEESGGFVECDRCGYRWNDPVLGWGN
jgi:DNA-directed RNA polymerase subunit M/transcription elongation factor TFIIS